MAAYIVATVRIREREAFARYASAIKGLSERYGGTSLLRGSVSEVLDGNSELEERVVVTRFETADAARSYIRSPEYQAAAALRAGAADVEIRLLEDAA